MTIKSIFFLTVFSALLCSVLPEILAAQQKNSIGGLPGSAIRMGFGARGVGMANALTAIKRGDIVGYYNPALVPYQEMPVGGIAIGLLPLDRNLNALFYTQNLKPRGGFSVGILNAGVSNIEGRNRAGLVTGTYSTSENVFLLTFGIRLGDNIAVGLSTKIFYYSLFENIASTTVGFDFGAIYCLSNDWALALVLQDIDSRYRWDTSRLYGREGNTTTEHFPVRRRIAIGYTPQFLDAAFAVEAEWIGSAFLTRVGTELSLYEGFYLRGGIDQVSFAGSVDAKPSVGFSVQKAFDSWKPGLHYTYVVEPYTTGGFHLISLTVHF